MKDHKLGVVLTIVLASGSAHGAYGDAVAQGYTEALTKAKLDADLGRYEEATATLTGLIARPDAPKAIRAEALVRLGSVRQSAGDAKGSLDAFARALREHGDDEAAVSLLVHSVGAVVPGPDLWKDRWPRLELGVDVTTPERPSAWIRWPEVAWAPRRPQDAKGGRVARFVRSKALYTGNSITLDFKDGDLGDIFRLFADISGLNVVVNPGTRGSATCRFSEIPWDDALDRILSANRLAYRLNGPVLHIGRVEDLGPAEQRFTGQPIDLDFQDVELGSAFRTIAEKSGLRVDVKPKVAGQVHLKLNQVPWDQAFDILARVNGLRWKRQGNVIAVGFADEVGR